MKVMHAWNQQIEPVAYTARDITAAAMARVVSHAPHHLYRGQACCAWRWQREQGTSVGAAAQSM